MQAKIFREILRHAKYGNFKWIFRNATHFSKMLIGSCFNRTLAPPLLAGLLVTYRCNLRCLFCDYPSRGNKKQEFTTEEFQRIIREFHSMGIPAIGFAGGDPILRKDIWTIVRTAVDLGMTTSLASNGTLWTDETIEQSFDSGLHLLGFSLESAEPHIHDTLQDQEGSWEKVCNTIRKVDDYRKKNNRDIVISVSVNFNFENLDDIVLMPAFAKSLGADQVNYIGMETGGIKEKEKAIRDALDIRFKDIKKIDSCVDELIKIKKKTGLVDNSYDSLEALKYQARGLPLPVKCNAGFTSLYVDCYGQIFPCMAFMENGKKVVAKYEPGKLEKFWYSHLYNDFRHKYLNSCRDCYWPCQNEMNYMMNVRSYVPGIRRFKEKLRS